MELADLLREALEEGRQHIWENKCTPTPVSRFGVRLHTAELSIGETAAILESLDVDRSHGAVWNWLQTRLKPKQPADGVVIADCG
jgi:hypothetical protein